MVFFLLMLAQLGLPLKLLAGISVRNPDEIGIKVLDMGVKNYAEAVAACRSINMQMAVVRSQEELNSVTRVIGHSKGEDPFKQ